MITRVLLIGILVSRGFRVNLLAHFVKCIRDMIRKIKNQYVVLSEKGDRVFGRYGTKAEAEKRLRQVEFFKNLTRHKDRNLVK